MIKKLFSTIALVVYSTITFAGDCDGNIQVFGSGSCNTYMQNEWKSQFFSLFNDGTLNAKKEGIRGDCYCNGDGKAAFCVATMAVHSCFVGASGQLWFSAERKITGASIYRWVTNSSGALRFNSEIAQMEPEVASGAATSLKQEIIKRRSKR